MATATLSPTYSPAAVAAKCTRIREFLETEVLITGRRTEMQLTQAALAAKLHILLKGTPGVAKSMTVDGLMRHMPHLRKFKTQAYKASPPEQFLGPLSIAGMAQDRYVRIVAGKAADCEVLVADELPRAPRAVLPALQGMMVEREFDSGDGVKPVPLQCVIGTANHIPQDEELEAFFDRLPIKVIVKGPQSQQQFIQIMRSARRMRENGWPAIPDDLIIGREEWERFQAFIPVVRVPEAIETIFAELWSNLLGVGIEPSPRRFGYTEAAMQAIAALDGRDEVSQDDMQVAVHTMWATEDEIEPVYKEVVKFASEWTKKKAELLDSFAELLDRLGQVQALVAAGSDTSAKVEIRDIHGDPIVNPDGSNPSVTDHGIKIANQGRSLDELLQRHAASATGQDIGELDAARVQIEAGRRWVSERLLGGLVL